MAPSEGRSSAYEQLEAIFEPVVHLQDIGSLLSWDQQVMMPSGGTPARASQRGTLARTISDRLTDEKLAALLEEVEPEHLGEKERAVVREVRRQHERLVDVPGELIERIQQKTAEAHPVWENAREHNDFDRFAPHLEEIIELQRDFAHHIDPDRDAYEVLFEEYEPYLSLETADAILTDLRDGLVPLIDQIQDAEAGLTTDAFDGTYETDLQESLCRDILDEVGYDWERGRLDTSTHPFSTGSQFDSRITTRFDEEDLLSAISSTMHEFGHAHYTLGVPTEAYGTPLGEAREMTVHESQSRFWENHVGRTEAFWSYILPRLGDEYRMLADIDPGAAYETANQVYPDNKIRVEADELTYHLHIVVRYEIERDLIAGELAVEEIPQVWNDKYESYLGTRPETDTEGCLQDVHWSGGSIGYFPTYSLGSTLAAQLTAAMEDDLGDLSARIRDGEFSELAEWMYDHIHVHGQRYTTPELITEATGESFTAEYFLDYADRKYGQLYDV